MRVILGGSEVLNSNVFLAGLTANTPTPSGNKGDVALTLH